MRFRVTRTTMVDAVTEAGVSSVPPKMTAAPCWKPLPLRVRSKSADPATTLLGESEVRTGPPLATVKLRVLEFAPSWRTLTGMAPGVWMRLLPMRTTIWEAVTEAGVRTAPPKLT